MSYKLKTAHGTCSQKSCFIGKTKPFITFILVSVATHVTVCDVHLANKLYNKAVHM